MLFPFPLTVPAVLLRLLLVAGLDGGPAPTFGVALGASSSAGTLAFVLLPVRALVWIDPPCAPFDPSCGASAETEHLNN